MKLRLLAATALSLSLSSIAQAGPIINPLAADLSDSSYTSSGQYIYSYQGQTIGYAKDAFNGGHWNGGGYGWHWVQADMGTVQTLTQLKLTTAQYPNGVSQHKVFLSDTNIGANYNNFNPIFTRSGFTTQGTVLDITLDQAYSGRYLLIAAYNAGSWSALGDVTKPRTDWQQTPVQDQGSATPVSEPATIALLGLGLIGLTLSRKKQAS